MGIRYSPKGYLEPFMQEKIRLIRRARHSTHHFAIFTYICVFGSLSSSILYPRLCQSMITLHPRILPISHTTASVGILGGFCHCHDLGRGRDFCKAHTCTRIYSGGSPTEISSSRRIDETWWMILKGARRTNGRERRIAGGSGK